MSKKIANFIGIDLQAQHIIYGFYGYIFLCATVAS